MLNHPNPHVSGHMNYAQMEQEVTRRYEAYRKREYQQEPITVVAYLGQWKHLCQCLHAAWWQDTHTLAKAGTCDLTCGEHYQHPLYPLLKPLLRFDWSRGRLSQRSECVLVRTTPFEREHSDFAMQCLGRIAPRMIWMQLFASIEIYAKGYSYPEILHALGRAYMLEQERIAREQRQSDMCLWQHCSETEARAFWQAPYQKCRATILQGTMDLEQQCEDIQEKEVVRMR
jgi:hypothetical protein